MHYSSVPTLTTRYGFSSDKIQDYLPMILHFIILIIDQFIDQTVKLAPWELID